MNDRSAEDAAAWVEREQLPFRILVDTDRAIGTAFGVSQPAVEKYVANNAEGRRPGLLIDEDGKIALALPHLNTVEKQVEAVSGI